MICLGCVTATERGNPKHGEAACDYPVSCPCQHGRNIEQDPEDDTVPAYVDTLPPEHPDRLAYERRVRRAIDKKSLPQEGVTPCRN